VQELCFPEPIADSGDGDVEGEFYEFPGVSDVAGVFIETVLAFFLVIRGCAKGFHRFHGGSYV